MDVVTDKAAKARAIIPAFVRLRSLKKKKKKRKNELREYSRKEKR